MTLDSVGRNNLPDVVLGDEREELETEAGSESVRVFDISVCRFGPTPQIYA